MHDFNCTQAADMNFELKAEGTRYLKENPKEVQKLCKNDRGYEKRIFEGSC